MSRVTLIGMPGSGKSSVGKILASRLGWNFVDTDKCMEERQGVPLQTLIDRVGDGAFRRIEEQTILELVVAEQTVISTGGSVVYSDAAMERLASISTVVFLDADFEAIKEHIALESPRGIVGMAQGGLRELFQERLPRYRHYATVIVHCFTETPEEVATLVLSELAKK
jgi:shikimate kinase